MGQNDFSSYLQNEKAVKRTYLTVFIILIPDEGPEIYAHPPYLVTPVNVPKGASPVRR